MIQFFMYAIKNLGLLSIDWNMTVLANERSENTHLKLNRKTCHLLGTGNKHENV